MNIKSLLITELQHYSNNLMHISTHSLESDMLGLFKTLDVYRYFVQSGGEILLRVYYDLQLHFI